MLLDSFMIMLAQVGKGPAPGDTDACGGIGALGCGCVCLALVLGMILPMMIGMYKSFTKAGEPGIAAFIPIWGPMVLCKIGGKEPTRFFFWLIPVAGIYFQIVDIIDFAKAYGKEAGFGIGLILLPMIFWPILGFGKSQYIGAPGGGAVARRSSSRYEDEDEDDRPRRR